MAENLMSLVDASAELRLSYQATWTLALRGTLVAQRVGGRWFCERASVLAFAKARRSEATTTREKGGVHA